jgi:hypothetical protein
MTMQRQEFQSYVILIGVLDEMHRFSELKQGKPTTSNSKFLGVLRENAGRVGASIDLVGAHNLQSQKLDKLRGWLLPMLKNLQVIV